MKPKTTEQLNEEIEELRHQLEEATDTIEAIRTGQVDAIVVASENGHELYTLKTADKSYRVFIEKMAEGAITLKDDGVILYSNSRFAQMVGRQLSNVIGGNFEDFIVDRDKDRFKNVLARTRKSDQKEEISLHSSNKDIPVQLSLTLLELENGPAVSIFVTDLTAQKNNQKQLEDNNRLLYELNHALEMSNSDLQQFASVASHDLQEPLRKIQIFSNLIIERGGDLKDVDFKKYIGKIMDSASRMRTLIVDVLNYSKLSAKDTAYQTVDLNEIIEEVREDYELLINEKEATIIVDNLPVVQGIRGQIRQVFQNIISNALKFSKQNVKPVIKITCKKVGEKSFDSPEQQEGTYCFISIMDNGIGFDEKYHANIFALFERLNSKESYAGTGIGMAITKKIMDKHNGLVQARSKPGEGAEFMLLFPLEQNG